MECSALAPETLQVAHALIGPRRPSAFWPGLLSRQPAQTDCDNMLSGFRRTVNARFGARSKTCATRYPPALEHPRRLRTLSSAGLSSAQLEQR